MENNFTHKCIRVSCPIQNFMLKSLHPSMQLYMYSIEASLTGGEESHGRHHRPRDYLKVKNSSTAFFV